MTLTPITFLIVCPLLFLAGMIDAIGGGGGLISLPAYLLAGVPVHNAIATNKLSSACGTTLATIRFIKKGLVCFKLAIPSIIAAMAGSFIGAKLSLMMSDDVLKKLMVFILPLAGVIVLNKKLFKENEDTVIKLCPRLYVVVMLSALIIGVYDGFYGPGTGTFLIICFTLFGGISLPRANGLAKVINLTTNITSLTVFIINGQVLFLLGIVAAACNTAGSYVGSGLVLTKGSKIIKPCIILVLVLLLIKIIFNI